MTTRPRGKKSAILAIRKETLARLEEKFGREQLTDILRKGDIVGSLDALTQSQAVQLLKFGSLDAIRNRIPPRGQEGVAGRDEGKIPSPSPEGVTGSSNASENDIRFSRAPRDPDKVPRAKDEPTPEDLRTIFGVKGGEIRQARPPAGLRPLKV